MRTLLICTFVVVLTTFALGQQKPAAAPQSTDKPAAASAQEKPGAAPVAQENPYTAFQKEAFDHVSMWVLRSAEKMPEENYSFKPTDAVRSFGQVLGHVANAQYLFCSSVRGEQNPAPKSEQTKTSKADIVASLKDSFAYCGKAWEGMNDSAGKAMVKSPFGHDMPKLNILAVNNMHVIEHYGNIITYLRLKNVVPPSTEEREQAQKASEAAGQQPKKY